MKKNETLVNDGGKDILEHELGSDGAVRQQSKKARGIRFTLIDLFILVMVAGAVFLIVYAYFPGLLSSFSKGDKVTVEYVLKLSSAEPEYASAITVGAKVTADKGGEMGTVVSVETAPAVIYRPSADGSVMERAEDQSRSDIRVTLRAEARDDGKSVSAGGIRIAVGAEYGFLLPGFSGSGTCVSVTLLPAE